jgi:hypothetical protein
MLKLMPIKIPIYIPNTNKYGDKNINRTGTSTINNNIKLLTG